MEKSQEGQGRPQPTLRDTTRNLVEAIMLDTWPRAGAIVDFGLDSQAHYEAIFYGVREGEITPEALDAALGNGEKLTALARSSPSNPHREITFSTSWDQLHGGPQSQDDGGVEDDALPTPAEAKALFAEWREDYAARASQPLPSPSQIGNTAVKRLDSQEMEVGLPQNRDVPSPGEIAHEPDRPEHGNGPHRGRGR